MLRTFRTFAALLTCLVVAVSAHAGSANDAGTGRDAPGTQGDAERLRAGDGTYTGFLGTTDADWFRIDTDSGASCVEARVGGTPTADAILEVRGTDKRRAYAPWGPAREGVLAFATPSVDVTWLGLQNTLPADAGDYTFTVSRRVVGSFATDSGTSGDAPSLAAQAAHVQPGCRGGNVGGGIVPDVSDVYRFSGQAGGTAVLSLVHGMGALEAKVLDADGTVLATLTNHDVVEVPLVEGGDYFLALSTSTASATVLTTASTSGSIDYLFGLIVGPPGGGPCRPNCMEMS